MARHGQLQAAVVEVEAAALFCTWKCRICFVRYFRLLSYISPQVPTLATPLFVVGRPAKLILLVKSSLPK